jgi:hypothetical protein
MMEAAGRFRFSHGENAVEPCACVQLKELRLAKVLADSASGRALPDRFTSGTQLYVYLQRHNCIGLTEGRARVYANKGQYVCIYDPKNKNKAIKPCAWTRREMLLK